MFSLYQQVQVIVHGLNVYSLTHGNEYNLQKYRCVYWEVVHIANTITKIKL